MPSKMRTWLLIFFFYLMAGLSDINGNFKANDEIEYSHEFSDLVQN